MALIGILIISIVGVAKRTSLRKCKGIEGEVTVGSILKKLDKDKYSVINNVMLRGKYGTSQIDHVVVSIYGIFVIETKNYSGTINGKENSDKWVQSLNGKKFEFQNPIKQNNSHVMVLSHLLNLDANLFIPIVVFMPRAELNVKVNSQVIYAHNLKKTIKRYITKTITSNQVSLISESIENLNIDSYRMRRKHAENISKKNNDNYKKIPEKICPCCGNSLVKRRGPYGVFMGCSNYPRCKYTSEL